jgi:hypothetical protein
MTAATLPLQIALPPEMDLEHPDWTCCHGLTLVEAEDLLDWVAAQGFDHSELELDEEGFVVRFRIDG